MLTGGSGIVSAPAQARSNIDQMIAELAHQQQRQLNRPRSASTSATTTSAASSVTNEHSYTTRALSNRALPPLSSAAPRFVFLNWNLDNNFHRIVNKNNLWYRLNSHSSYGIQMIDDYLIMKEGLFSRYSCWRVPLILQRRCYRERSERWWKRVGKCGQRDAVDRDDQFRVAARLQPARHRQAVDERPVGFLKKLTPRLRRRGDERVLSRNAAQIARYLVRLFGVGRW